MLEKLKGCYILWHQYHELLTKTQKYSLGNKIDELFIEAMEAIACAGFLSPQEKQPWIRLAIRKTDTIKVLLMVLWETKSLEDKKYIALSIKLDEVGKNLGGWNGQITKQNSPNKVGEK